MGYIGTTEKDYLIYNPIFENSVLVGYAVALNPLYMNVVPNTIIIPEQYNNMPIVKLGFTTYTNVFSNVTSRQDRYYNFTSATLREIRIPSHVKGFIAKNNFTSGLQGKFEIESIYLNDPSGWQVYDSNSKKYISRIGIRIKPGTGTVVNVDAQYDSSGKFTRLFTLRSSSDSAVTLPVIPVRCDHVKIRLSGTGEFSLLGAFADFEEGSEIL